MAFPTLYQRLDPQRQEIRLLRIHPSGDFEAPVHLEIYTANLQDNPPPRYRALSYVWGDQTRRAELIIDRIAKPILAGWNLVEAIRHIRNSIDEIVLWVDAICINQQDNLEKGHQVRLMAEIYHKASEVIAWLGKEENASSMAMELVETWATSKDLVETGVFDVQKTYLDQSYDEFLRLFQESVPIAFVPQMILALRKFGFRPYWTRAWIYQELALAKRATVQCGKTTKPLEYLRRIYLTIAKLHMVRSEEFSRNSPFHITHYPKPMMDMLAMLNGSPGILPFSQPVLTLRMLVGFRDFNATDPRDKVFALLGLVAQNGQFSDLIGIDYEKSVKQVYIDLAKYLILTSQTLHVLNMSHVTASIASDNLPTWVPDWQVNKRLRYDVEPKSKKEEALISLGLVSQLVLFFPDNTLVAKGFNIGVVPEVFANGMFPFWNGPEAFRQFKKQFMEGAPILNKTALSAYFRLVLYRHWKIQRPDSQLSEDSKFLCFAALFLKNLSLKIERSPGLIKDIVGEESLIRPSGWTDTTVIEYRLISAFTGEAAPAEEKAKLKVFLEVAGEDFSQQIAFERQLTLQYHLIFRTEGGLLGLGPKGMAEGDVICYLAAHPNPFVLRPVNSGYVSVGHCDILDLELPEVSEEAIPHMIDYKIF